jgi:steroid delta-isomerase-like uncharacterized protein
MKSIESRAWLLALVGLVLLLCFAFACRDKAAMAELEKFRAQAKAEEENKDLAKRVIDALNEGDVGAIKELAAPEFVRYSPSTTVDIHSLEEFTEFVKVIHQGLSDLHIGIEESYAEGDRVICRYLMKATHQGEFMGFPATGNKIGTSGILIFRIKNGKVGEIREEYDSVGFLQQFGMELRPKEVKKKSN